MTRAAILRWLFLAALVAGIGFGLLYRDELHLRLQAFRGWIRELGLLGQVVLAASYVPVALLFIPASWLTLVGGFAFGLWAVIPVSLGSTIGASAAFLTGRYLARGWVEEWMAGSPRFQALDRAVGAQGFKIVLLTRLSPVIPFNFLNYAYGLTRVRFRDFVLASWIGMLPGTFLYVYIGSAVGAVASGESEVLQQVLFGIGLVVTVIVTVYVTRLARRALAEAVPLSEDQAAAALGERETAKPV